MDYVYRAILKCLECVWVDSKYDQNRNLIKSHDDTFFNSSKIYKKTRLSLCYNKQSMQIFHSWTML